MDHDVYTLIDIDSMCVCVRASTMFHMYGYTWYTESMAGSVEKLFSTDWQAPTLMVSKSGRLEVE